MVSSYGRESAQAIATVDWAELSGFCECHRAVGSASQGVGLKESAHWRLRKRFRSSS